MSYEFDDTTGQRIVCTANLLTSFPYTVSGWFYQNSSPSSYTTGFAMADEADIDNGWVQYIGRDGGSNWRLYTGHGNLTGGYTTGAWQHVVISTDGSDNWRLVEDGSATTGTPTPPFPPNPAFYWGGLAEWTDEVYDGRICETGMWSVQLSVAEEQSLATGVCPLLVRPQSLVSYLPLRGDIIDRVAGDVWSLSGSPVAGADHAPGIIYPAKPWVPAWYGTGAGATYQRAIVEGLKAGG